MSSRIAKLLGEPEHAVRKMINRLEDKNGYPSHDVRHLAENIQQVRRKISELGLDPDDTTAEELYYALSMKFQKDSRRFDEHFGVYGRSFDEKTAKAAELISGNMDLPERWVLKNQAAKTLLRQHPPGRVMKQLRYRSVESFIKREDMAEIYLVLGFIESSAWNKAHSKLLSTLDSTAFEARCIKIIPLKSTKWGPGPDINVVFSNDYGSLGLEPTEFLESAGLLSLVVLLLESVAALSVTSASAISQFSPAVTWWADTDGLIASLAGENTSLNIMDTVENHLLGRNFAERALASAKQSFWRQLQNRYKNQLAPEEDLLMNFNHMLELPAGPTFQPAFEYEEVL